MKSIQLTWSTFKTCCSILVDHVALILFPLLAFILNILLLLIIAVPIYRAFIRPMICHETFIWPRWYFWCGVVFLIIVIRLIALALNGAASIYFVSRQINQSCSIGHVIWMSFSRFFQILKWISFSYTLGWMLVIFEDQLKWLHRFIQKRIGGPLSVAMIFLPVVLFLSKSGFKNSLQESIRIHQIKWANKEIMRIEFGWLFLVVRIPVYIILGIVAYKIADPWVRYAAIGLLLVIEFFLQELNQLVRLIFISSLYSYAVNDVLPKGFSQEQLDNVFVIANNE